MAVKITESVWQAAKELNQAGDVIGAYRVLAEAGDKYAENALVVMQQIDNPDSIFACIVQVHWDRVAPGARETKFLAVGQQHQAQYIELIEKKGTGIYEGGDELFMLPDTEELEWSYRKALVDNGLPALTTVDSMFSLIDRNLELSSHPFYALARAGGLEDITWAKLLDPELEEARIKFDSDEFKDDHIESPIGETLLTVAALLVQARIQGEPQFVLAAVKLLNLVKDILGDAAPQVFGLEDAQAQALTAGLIVTFDNTITDMRMISILDSITLGDASAVGDIRNLEWFTRAISQALHGTDPGEFADKESLYDATAALLSEISGDLSKHYRLTEISSLSAGSLRDSAKEDTVIGRAYRYALVNLQPFVMTQSSTGQPVPDALGTAYNLDAFSDKYLEDRAFFLKTLTTFYTTDASVKGNNLIEFTDLTTSDLPLVTQQATSDHVSQRYTFGSEADEDDIKGGEDKDHLYGGAGNDTLEGKGGNDYLEGGEGIDTYIYTTDSGFDTILDTDGIGSIKFDEDTLNGGIKIGDGIYQSVDGKYIYVFDAGTDGIGTLIINNCIRVENFKDGNLHIALSDYLPEETPDTTNTITGSNEHNDSGSVPHPALEGGSGNDHILGLAGSDDIFGMGGDDFIEGHGGTPVNGDSDSDFLLGGDGDDVIFASASGDMDSIINSDDVPVSHTEFNQIGGDEGDDRLYGSAGSEQIYGGAGNDQVWGGANGDTIVGCGEFLEVSPGNWDVNLMPKDYTAEDNDILNGGAGDDVIWGHMGDDVISGGSGSDSLYGDLVTSTNESLPGQYHGNDTIYGGSGNDSIVGDGGDDLLVGGDGNDFLHGDSPSVLIEPTMNLLFPAEYHGVDRLFGNDGEDILIGGAKADMLYGGDGDDKLYGDDDTSGLSQDQHGDDYLDGGAGNDILAGNSGSDTLIGGDGDDDLFGDTTGEDESYHGNDTLIGGEGNDGLWGGGGADNLNGGVGDDRLFGEDGNDVLVGGAGNDYLKGGDGADRFIFYSGDGVDFIEDGDAGDTVIINSSSEISASIVGNNAQLRLEYGAGDALHISGGTSSKINRFDLGDGQILTKAELLNMALDEDVDIELEEAGEASGGSGDDSLNGSAGDDLLYGLNGDDCIEGNNGDDVLHGGLGDDLLYGGEGNDTIYTEGGRDRVYGSNGDDSYYVHLNSGDEVTITDESGNDSLFITTDLQNPLVYQQIIDGDLHIQVGGSEINVRDWQNRPLEILSFTGGGLNLSAVDFQSALNDAPTPIAINPVGILEDSALDFDVFGNLFQPIHATEFTYKVEQADASPLPEWLQFDSQTGHLVGTPLNEDVGTLSLRAIVSVAGGLGSAANFDLEIQNTNDAPVAQDDYVAFAGTDLTLDFVSNFDPSEELVGMLETETQAYIRALGDKKILFWRQTEWIGGFSPGLYCQSIDDAGVPIGTPINVTDGSVIPSTIVEVGDKLAVMSDSYSHTQKAYYSYARFINSDLSVTEPVLLMQHVMLNGKINYSPYTGHQFLSYSEGVYKIAWFLEGDTSSGLMITESDGETYTSYAMYPPEENIASARFTHVSSDQSIAWGFSDDSKNEMVLITFDTSSDEVVLKRSFLPVEELNQLRPEYSQMKYYIKAVSDTEFAVFASIEIKELNEEGDRYVKTRTDLYVSILNTEDNTIIPWNSLASLGENDYLRDIDIGSLSNNTKGIFVTFATQSIDGMWDMKGRMLDFSGMQNGHDIILNDNPADSMQDLAYHSDYSTVIDENIYTVWMNYDAILGSDYTDNEWLSISSVGFGSGAGTSTTIDPLANDTDPDLIHGNEELTLIDAEITSGFGSVSIVDNKIHYQTNGAYDALPEELTENVQIEYTMSDAAGVTATATVTVEVNGTVNYDDIGEYIDYTPEFGSQTLTTGDGDDYVRVSPPAMYVSPITIYTGGGNDTINLDLAGYSGVRIPWIVYNLSGGVGNDIYFINPDNSVATSIHLNDTGGSNSLVMGICASHYSPSLGYGSLKITFENSQIDIHLENFDPNDVLGGPRDIDTFVFSDITYSYEEFVALGFDLEGTTDNDVIDGTSVVDRITGHAGDDTLSGGAGDDVLDGGIGADNLYGGEGSDRYLFRKGDGIDVIHDDAGGNTIQLLDVELTDITTSSLVDQDGNSYLVIKYGSSDEIHIKNGFSHLADTYEIVDSTFSAEELLRLTNSAPEVNTPIQDLSTAEDSLFTFQVPEGTFVDPDSNDTLSLSVDMADGSPLPGWLVFDAATNTFSGTPDNDDVGTVEVRLTATDDYGSSVSDMFSLEITNVNDAPELINALTDVDAVEGDSISYTIPTDTFRDIDASDSLSFTATLANGDGLPTWLAFDLNTMTLAGELPMDAAGEYDISIHAADQSGASVSDTFHLSVTNLVQYPTWRRWYQGTSFNDLIIGRGRSEWLYGYGGNDQLIAYGGNDRLHGGDGNDMLDGGYGRDVLWGGRGDDQLYGGAGRDTLYGGAGDDEIDGGSGNDILNGGIGSDTYRFSLLDGRDTIRNYDAGVDSLDVLSFDGIAYNDLMFTKQRNSLIIDVVGTDDSVTVRDWFRGEEYQLDTIETSDLILQNDQVNQLVNAMAQFDVSVGIGGFTPHETRDQFESILVSYC